MRAVALSLSIFAMLSLGGCLDATLDDGTLMCSSVPGRACPRGYYCANNRYCYHDGKGPGTTPLPDLSVAHDFSLPPPPPPPPDFSTTEPPPSD
jgi:hypothetical protein